MLAMILKEFRQVGRDRRTLAMLIVMPVVLLLVFGYAASFDVTEIPTVVVGPGADNVSSLLPDVFAVDSTDANGTRDDAVSALVAGDAHVAVIAEPGAPVVLIDGSELLRNAERQKLPSKYQPPPRNTRREPVGDSHALPSVGAPL